MDYKKKTLEKVEIVILRKNVQVFNQELPISLIFEKFSFIYYSFKLEFHFQIKKILIFFFTLYPIAPLITEHSV